MQYSLPLEGITRLAEAHRRLAAAYGPQPECLRLDPVSQLVLAMLGWRTLGEVSKRAFETLANRFARWEELAQAPGPDIEALTRNVTFAESKAVLLPRALRMIIARRGRLSLDFLSGWPTEAALAWLDALPGVGPKTGATVLNFSTLHQRALVVDTHHRRVACRLGLIPPTAGLGRASRLLARQIPDGWTPDDVEEHHLLMKRLGQDHCRPRIPICPPCPLRSMCSEPDRSLPRAADRTIR